MEPVFRRMEEVLKEFGIRALPIMTGQGYHFSFRVGMAGPVHRKLESVGRLESTLAGKYRFPDGRRKPVSLSAGRAFDGMGRLLEFISHLLLENLRKGYRGMPVVCTDVSVGRQQEAIDLDLSMYGDPLYTRDIRCPFSTYQKHKMQKGKFGVRVAAEVPVLVTLPRPGSLGLEECLRLRTDFEKSARYASKVKTAIPEASAGCGRLIEAYRASELYRFHRYFDSAEHDPPQRWPATYDRLDLRPLPPCVAHSLRNPNDNILKPTNLQALTRVLLRMGWHPKHIAGLVRSKLERDYGWGLQWLKYDAATRANFYVRLFSGQLAAGLDGEEDLNCVSHAEKGYCVQPGCGHNLAQYRTARAPELARA
jgi:hypothetical protein